jgi:hypothetical protein
MSGFLFLFKEFMYITLALCKIIYNHLVVKRVIDVKLFTSKFAAASVFGACNSISYIKLLLHNISMSRKGKEID